MFSKRIYLDNTATTRTRREVINEMKKYFHTDYANPSSIHRDGFVARGSIEMARERIARILKCDSNEIIFTGSGTEANNLAVKGTAYLLKNKKNHIITSQIEHSSVLRTCQSLESEGFEVSYLPVDKCGWINLSELEKSITNKTALVSLIYVNNEIGTIQDIEKIISLVKKRGVILHIDAVQALPYMKFDLKNTGVDLASFSGHKLFAPKGIGVLYIKNGTNIKPLIYGGEQEFGIRSGTENIPYIMGLSKAVILNDREKNKYNSHLVKLRNYLIKNVLKDIPDCILTGDPAKRAPNNASFCFKGINGKMLVRQLSYFGIETSSGAACSSPKNEASHVLKACGIADEFVFGSLRVTIGKYNNKRQIDKFLKILKSVVTDMRENKIKYDNESIFISQKEFKLKLEKKENIQILDVRSPRIPKSEIPGSIRIPFWQIRSKMKKLSMDTEIIVICYQGDVISPDVREILVKNGFEKVKVLKGGYFNYVGFSF